MHLQGVVGVLGSWIEELKGRGLGHQEGREWGQLGSEVLTPPVDCHLCSYRAGQRWEGHAVQWGPLTWLSPASSKLEGLPLCLLTSCTTVAGRVFLLVSL